MGKSSTRIMAITWMALASMSSILYMSSAADPSPLQDFCVGVTDPQSAGMYLISNHVDLASLVF